MGDVEGLPFRGIPIDFDHVASHRSEMKKKPKKLSLRPAAKKVSVKEAKPKLEGAKTTAQAGGFVTISETRIRKVYR